MTPVEEMAIAFEIAKRDGKSHIDAMRAALRAIESLGLAIVNAEPTDAIVQAMQRAYDDPSPSYGVEARMYIAAIAASPFSKEKS